MNESHLKALKILSENPALSQRAISRALGLSLGKVNYVVNELAERGLVRKLRGQDRERNGQCLRYVLTGPGRTKMESLGMELLKKKTEQYKVLKKEIETLKRELGPVDRGL